MNENEEFEFRLRLEHEQGQPKATQAEKATAPAGGFGDTLRAGLRTVAPVLSSVLENPQGALTAGGQLVMGGLRGVKDGIDGGAEWLAKGYDKVAGTQEAAPVKAMNDAGKTQFKQDNPSVGASIGRVGGNMLVTAPVGPVLGAGATALGLTRAGTALASSGMTAGQAAPGVAGWVGNQALRAGTGAAVGGASAALVDSDSLGMGAGIGAITPGVLQLAGKFGSTVYNAVKGNQAGAGKLLAQAMGISEAELAQVIKAANAAPESIVDGSKLTLSQAMQQQGVKQPAVTMLERIAAEGPGGNQLLSRYAQQGESRLNALKNQGAQTYQGAAATEAENTGNKLAALLRTQAGDERAAVRAAWDGSDGSLGVHGRAVQEGAALQLPLDRMKALVADRMGDGYTGSAATAGKTITEAERIGTDLLPGIKPIPQSAGQTQSLEQAVRRAGGIQPGNYLGKEISELGRKQSKTTGLVSQYGRNVEAMADDMHARGFLPDNDPATLLQALRSGGGRRIYADDHVEAGFQRMAEQAMGDMPGPERVAKAVPFKSFQALRSSAGQDAARLSEKTGNAVEAGVMTQFEKLMAGRADDAAAGNLLPGESMSRGLMDDYNAARNLTRDWHQRYEGGNAISRILDAPGGNFRLNGNEVTNKLWHGGAGLAGDVSTLKQVLSDNNRNPAMDSLRQFIMTDAAGKTTASGNFGAALPNYVESRLPGLQEALSPEQLNALTRVAADIRNAEAAANVAGLRGSDSYAKVSRAMDTGIFDSDGAKSVAKLLSLKGLGGETIRNKLAEMVTQSKGKTIAALMADPKAAAAALADKSFVRSLDNEALQKLRLVVARGAPILAAD